MIVREGASYLAVIPAHGGSKSIPGKNIRPIGGRPLLAWSIDHARDADTPMRVIVTTDDRRIANIALASGAEVPTLRPEHLSTDFAATEPALIHALDTTPYTEGIRHVILLQPTSPVRDAGSLDAAVRLYEAECTDSLVSVAEISPFLWCGSPAHPVPTYDINRRPRRQDIPGEDRRYTETGSIYIVSVDILRSSINRLGGRIAMFVMKPHEAIDIDTEFDFWLADQWLGTMHDR